MNILLMLLIFLKIGAISFGGGYAVISMIQQEVVHINGWLTSTEFINIVGLSGITPGPIAVNASIFVGYKLLGVSGALLATIAVLTIPCILSLLATLFLEKFRHLDWVDSLLFGIKPAVIGLIAMAFFTISKESITRLPDLFIGVSVYFLLSKTKISPVLVLLGAAFIGIILY